jgi:hypothetical protein
MPARIAFPAHERALQIFNRLQPDNKPVG